MLRSTQLTNFGGTIGYEVFQQPFAPLCLKTMPRFLVVLLLTTLAVFAAPADCLNLAAHGLTAGDKVTPQSLTGDFDGDGKPDQAAVVSRGHERGILVCLSSVHSPVVLGAGIAFNDMRNLDFSSWRLHKRGVRVARGAGQGRPPVLRGDALELEWESASAIVYWNGTKFIWYQQGD